MYSMVSIFNNSVILYLQVAKQLNLKSPHHKRKNWYVTVYNRRVSRLTVVITLQHIQISNHFTSESI